MLTKTLLKNALLQMLKEQAIYQISIRDLCQNAGINRSTFYKYYGSQFDLLAEMEQDFMDDISSFLDEEKDSPQEPLVQVLQYLEKNIEFVRLLLNSNVDPDFPKRLFAFEPIQRSLQEFSSEEMTPEEQEYAMNYVLYGGFQITKIWVNKDADREDPKWMAALMEKQIRK